MLLVHALTPPRGPSHSNTVSSELVACVSLLPWNTPGESQQPCCSSWEPRCLIPPRPPWAPNQNLTSSYRPHHSHHHRTSSFRNSPIENKRRINPLMTQQPSRRGHHQQQKATMPITNLFYNLLLPPSKPSPPPYNKPARLRDMAVSVEVETVRVREADGGRRVAAVGRFPHYPVVDYSRCLVETEGRTEGESDSERGERETSPSSSSVSEEWVVVRRRPAGLSTRLTSRSRSRSQLESSCNTVLESPSRERSKSRKIERGIRDGETPVPADSVPSTPFFSDSSTTYSTSPASSAGLSRTRAGSSSTTETPPSSPSSYGKSVGYFGGRRGLARGERLRVELWLSDRYCPLPWSGIRALPL
ncbi:hypothetical protein VTK56DRAFT_9097 [Thermocarpiscus australiensis]